MRFEPTFAAAVAVAALGLAAALSGCSQDSEIGDVKGQVTFKKEPVPEGSITFLNVAEGGTFGADLNADGTYAVRGGVKVGEYTVVITPPVEIVDTDPGKSPPAPVEKNMPNIPQQYRMQGSTKLRATVKAGPNEHNFDMQP